MIQIFHGAAAIMKTGQRVNVCLLLKLFVIFDQLAFESLCVCAENICNQCGRPEDCQSIYDLKCIVYSGDQENDGRVIQAVIIQTDTERTQC